jgi:hypothetical protein
MKTFVGRIVTVPDGAGRSVTVSKWGVAQSSRHLHLLSTVESVQSLFIEVIQSSDMTVYRTTVLRLQCIESFETTVNM